MVLRVLLKLSIKVPSINLCLKLFLLTLLVADYDKVLSAGEHAAYTSELKMALTVSFSLGWMIFPPCIFSSSGNLVSTIHEHSELGAWFSPVGAQREVWLFCGVGKGWGGGKDGA